MKENKFLSVLKKIFFSYAWIPFVVVGIDLLTKWLVQTHLEWRQQVTIIPNFLFVTLEYNLGAAWSLGYGLRWLWITVSVVLSAGLTFYFVKQFKKLTTIYRIVLTLMIGGAVGNMIDRCFYWEKLVGFDGVIDWISFYLGYKIGYFPTFNVADSCLVIGVIIMIIVLVIEIIKDAKAKAKDGAYTMKPKDYEAKKEAEEKAKKEAEIEPKEDAKN
jgi:signal peptidase II